MVRTEAVVGDHPGRERTAALADEGECHDDPALTVLGGSAASVGTGQGCAGYLVEHGDTRIVLDLGPGTLQELRKHTDFRAIDAVVISHLHVDHMLDVVSLRFSLSYNPVKPERRVGLWMPPGGIELLNRLAAAFDFEGDPETLLHQRIRGGGVRSGPTLTIGDVDLTFAPTVHWVPCWAIRVHPAKPAATCSIRPTPDQPPISLASRTGPRW